LGASEIFNSEILRETCDLNSDIRYKTLQCLFWTVFCFE
jgi:hypothetical protein